MIMDAAMGIARCEHEAFGKMLVRTTSKTKYAKPRTSSLRYLEGIQNSFSYSYEECLATPEGHSPFPALERKALSRQGGRMALMLIDHEKAQRLTREKTEVPAGCRNSPRHGGRSGGSGRPSPLYS
jgi:hypothetical protein